MVESGMLSQYEINALLNGVYTRRKDFDRFSNPRMAYPWFCLTRDILTYYDDEIEKKEQEPEYIDVKKMRKKLKGMNEQMQKDLKFLEKAIAEIPEYEEDEDRKLIMAVKAVTELANIARKEGLLSLEEYREDLDDGCWIPSTRFLRALIELIIDGTDQDIIRDIGYRRLAVTQARGYEALIILVYIEGMLMLQSGNHPIRITERLMTMLPDSTFETAKKDCGEEYLKENKLRSYFSKGPVLPKSIREMEERIREEKEEKHPLEELCNEGRIGLNDTDGCFLEMRMLELLLPVLDDSAIVRLLEDTEQSDLMLAIKGLSGEATSRILGNLPETQEY